MAMHIHRLQHKRCQENKEGGSDKLPYGYKRAEVIGGMINSVALISLSAYVSHERHNIHSDIPFDYSLVQCIAWLVA